MIPVVILSKKTGSKELNQCLGVLISKDKVLTFKNCVKQVIESQAQCTDSVGVILAGITADKKQVSYCSQIDIIDEKLVSITLNNAFDISVNTESKVAEIDKSQVFTSFILFKNTNENLNLGTLNLLNCVSQNAVREEKTSFKLSQCAGPAVAQINNQTLTGNFVFDEFQKLVGYIDSNDTSKSTKQVERLKCLEIKSGTIESECASEATGDAISTQTLNQIEALETTNTITEEMKIELLNGHLQKNISTANQYNLTSVQWKTNTIDSATTGAILNWSQESTDNNSFTKGDIIVSRLYMNPIQIICAINNNGMATRQKIPVSFIIQESETFKKINSYYVMTIHSSSSGAEYSIDLDDTSIQDSTFINQIAPYLSDMSFKGSLPVCK
jgi:hypothetical protein